jgi:hypothetical protein
MNTKFWLENLKRRDYLGALGAIGDNIKTDLKGTELEGMD